MCRANQFAACFFNIFYRHTVIKKPSEQPNSAATVKATASDAGAAQPQAQINPIDLVERRRFRRPLPLPEVLEGDGSQDDWDTWVRLTEGQAKP